MLLDPRIKDYPGFEELRGLKLLWAAELDPEDICQRCGVPWMVHGSRLYPWCPDGDTGVPCPRLTTLLNLCGATRKER